jgi:hypothetical protein
LFSALFDRENVDLIEEFQAKKKKKLKPNSSPEHIVKALCFNDLEEEVRRSLLLMDIQLRNEIETKQRGNSRKRNRPSSAHSATGDEDLLSKDIESKLTNTRTRPANHKDLDCSSSPVDQLRTFSYEPIQYPIHKLDFTLPRKERIRALMELTQNMCRKSRNMLSELSKEISRVVESDGLGYMANTGRRHELNVKCIEIAPRKDIPLPNEVFYVATKPIRRGDEILAAYNNVETRRKQLIGAPTKFRTESRLSSKVLNARHPKKGSTNNGMIENMEINGSALISDTGSSSSENEAINDDANSSDLEIIPPKENLSNSSSSSSPFGDSLPYSDTVNLSPEASSSLSTLNTTDIESVVRGHFQTNIDSENLIRGLSVSRLLSDVDNLRSDSANVIVHSSVVKPIKPIAKYLSKG